MEMSDGFKIASFYRFQELQRLPEIKSELVQLMRDNDVFGTIIIADEGFNGTVSAKKYELGAFLEGLESVFGSMPDCKFSTHDEPGFKRQQG